MVKGANMGDASGNPKIYEGRIIRDAGICGGGACL
jgi:hypothetical protein